MPVRVLAASDEVRMDVLDDGPGIAEEARSAAALAGHRGLDDMVTEAAGCGASVEIGDRGRPTGTAVRFRWPAGSAASLREDPQR